MKYPLWAVYKKFTKKVPEGMNAVCEQEEWNAMELAKPGQQQLIQGGIANEAMAERLARGKSGDSIEHRSGAIAHTSPVVELSSAPGARSYTRHGRG
jgi:hypothetical protein